MTWYSILLILMNCLFAFCFFYLFSKQCPICRRTLEDTRKDRWTIPKIYSLSVLQTLTCWNPPRDGHLHLVASVHLGERFLLYSINPNATSGEIINNLDRIAHCLLCTEEPELTEHWAQELETIGTKFEEGILQ